MTSRTGGPRLRSVRFAVHRRAFTVLELVIAVSLIGIMAAVVFVAIDPARRYADTRAAARLSNINTLERAAQLYARDSVNEPAGGIPTGALAAKAVCRRDVSDPGCVNIDALVDRGALGEIPVDAEETDPIRTGYRIYKSPASAVYACSDFIPSGEEGSCATCDGIPGSFAGGDGSAENPYQVCSCRQLPLITNSDADGAYALVADIDCGETASWNDGRGFDPIDRFAGVLDGDGYAISGISIRRPQQTVGLFSRVEIGAVVKNLAITGADIAGGNYTGILAGWFRGTADNVRVGGTVRNYDASSGDSIGGLVGYAALGSIYEDCAADVAVSGRNALGGLIGSTEAAVSVTRCSARGTVTGGGAVGGNVGGLIGAAVNSVIIDSYADVDISGASHNYGGLTGNGADAGSHRNYASGTVYGGSGLRGCVSAADPDGAFTDAYYDAGNCGQPSNGVGLARTSAQMKRRSTFAGWDFDEVWQIDEGESYPTLR